MRLMVSQTDREKLALALSELKNRYNAPFYKIFPEKGPYSLDRYPKHKEFIEATLDKMIVYFQAANRIGKTLLIAYIAMVWMTGIYPKNWKGKRFNKPVKLWLCGVDHEQIKEALQELLIGSALKRGDGGLLPPELRDRIKATYKARPQGALSTLEVPHVSGINSVATFKGYAQKTVSLQGAKVDALIIDEEPPAEKYSEMVVRLVTGVAEEDRDENYTPPSVLIAATPLHGLSPFISRFLFDETPVEERNYKVITATWNDVPHLSEDEKRMLYDEILRTTPHLLQARTEGLPYIGGGMVFPVNPDRYTIEPIVSIPRHCLLINGLDVGNTTFAVFAYYDPIKKKTTIYKELEFKNIVVPIKAQALRTASTAPYVADTSMNAVNEVDQVQVKQHYIDAGLTLLHPNKKLKESIIEEFLQGLMMGTLEITRDCKILLKCLLTYHRNEQGDIKKKDNPDDHAIDASLYMYQKRTQGVTQAELFLYRQEEQFYGDSGYSVSQHKFSGWV